MNVETENRGAGIISGVIALFFLFLPICFWYAFFEYVYVPEGLAVFVGILYIFVGVPACCIFCIYFSIGTLRCFLAFEEEVSLGSIAVGALFISSGLLDIILWMVGAALGGLGKSILGILLIYAPPIATILIGASLIVTLMTRKMRTSTDRLDWHNCQETNLNTLFY